MSTDCEEELYPRSNLDAYDTRIPSVSQADHIKIQCAVFQSVEELVGHHNPAFSQALSDIATFAPNES